MYVHVRTYQIRVSIADNNSIPRRYGCEGEGEEEGRKRRKEKGGRRREEKEKGGREGREG